ncbi:hypothetical protein [Variovorax sp. PBL-H6]|nr:hypothetical protein [Variovorax sp. PBL-H6]
MRGDKSSGKPTTLSKAVWRDKRSGHDVMIPPLQRGFDDTEMFSHVFAAA